jgi:hypothetical protein
MLEEKEKRTESPFERDVLRAEKMTMHDVMNLFSADLSTLQVRASLENDAPVASPLPPIPKDEVDKYIEPEIIGLLFFARAGGWKPLLVEFSQKPSKAFEDRFRQAAKSRNIVLHFYRLDGGWIILEARPKETPEQADANLLKRLGVRW